MESAVYQVSEDEGSVEVCAVLQSPPGVECPVDFSVSVTISTSDGSAGDYKLLVCVGTHMHFYCHSLSFYLWLTGTCHILHINTTSELFG